MGQGGLCLGATLDQRGAVGGLLEQAEVLTEAAVRLAQAALAQGMDLGTRAAAEAKVRVVEQIQFPMKGGFDPARALGHCRQPAEVGRKPVEDETGLGERPSTEDQARGGFNHFNATPRSRSASAARSEERRRERV